MLIGTVVGECGLLEAATINQNSGVGFLITLNKGDTYVWIIQKEISYCG